MMNKIIKQKLLSHCLAPFLIILLSSSPSYASFEDVGAGARAAGMANSFTAIADDVYSVYYNPAGLAGLKNPEAASSMGKMFMNLSDNSDIGDTNLMFAYPAKFASLGVGVKKFALDGYYTENQYIFSAARRFKYLDIGVSFKQMTAEYASTIYTTNAIDNTTGLAGAAADPVFASGLSKSGSGVDAGIMKNAGDVRFAVALQNIVSPDMGIKESYKLPLRVKAGMALIKKDYKLSMEYDKEDAAGSFRLGGEFDVLKVFRLRGGFEYGAGIANVSAGASYDMNLFSFDYAFTLPLGGIEETLGNHWLGLSVKFGEVPETGLAAGNKMKQSVLYRAKKDPVTEKIKKLTLKNMKRLYFYALAAEKRGEYEKARNYHQQVIIYNVPEVVADDDRIKALIVKSEVAQHKHGGKVSSVPGDRELMKKYFGRATEYYKKKNYK
ncbi:MAG: hypothetical protein U9O97_05970, partial [Elusimicrobiota bacterium]|nr:hypothetical protein [Elusimicrobiota bacterium]